MTESFSEHLLKFILQHSPLLPNIDNENDPNVLNLSNMLSRNPNITFDIVEKYIDHPIWNWSDLSWNQNVTFYNM